MKSQASCNVSRTFKCQLDGQELNLESLVFNESNSSAPVILALHGWLDNAVSFQPLSQHLSNYQVIALDFPGHGHSDWLPAGCDYNIWQSLGLLVQVIEQIDAPIHLVGHSMGGNIATLFAASFPDSIVSLTLIDALGPLVTDEANCAKQLRQGINDSLKPMAESKTYPSLEQAMSSRLKVTPFFNAQTLSPIIERNMQKKHEGYVWRVDARLRRASKVRFSEAQVQAMLKDISCPTLLIKASNSFINEHFWQARKNLIADMDTHTIEGEHHLHYLPESCVQVATVLKNTLNQVILS